ncbi:hypothetical protein NBRC116187_06030 [Halopseudomonas sabulinigri]|uniref:Uncharacterized protein n=1 Tax=Halopseudomonas sabulinigri TaxID=472181 RepID=A0ABP9ZLA1_9GAMM
MIRWNERFCAVTKMEYMANLKTVALSTVPVPDRIGSMVGVKDARIIGPVTPASPVYTV